MKKTNTVEIPKKISKNLINMIFIKYNNKIENLIMDIKEHLINQIETQNEYNKILEKFELYKGKRWSAGEYIKFIGKIVEYVDIVEFIKKTFAYIFNGGNSYWITINVHDNEIEYNFLKDLTSFSKNIVTYRNSAFNPHIPGSKPWIKKSFANILYENSQKVQYERVDFIPSHQKVEFGTFNLFTSLKAKKSCNIIDESKIDKILWHIRYIWCKNNDTM